MMKCQKHPTCGIFLKRGLFKDSKNYIICVKQANTKNKYKIHKYKNTYTKYTNTAYDEVPKIPNMWYIFEKKVVQGYQK